VTSLLISTMGFKFGILSFSTGLLGSGLLQPLSSNGELYYFR
jgi:hypothetical protein